VDFPDEFTRFLIKGNAIDSMRCAIDHCMLIHAGWPQPINENCMRNAQLCELLDVAT